VKTLVLGLGNPILRDDGIGIHVVRAVAAGCHRDDVVCAEASLGGLRLLDLLSGYERVILVDAIQTPGGEPGQVYRLRADDLRRSLHSGSTHDLSLAGALALGRSLGMPLPDNGALTILAVEAGDVLTFGETCTPPVAEAIQTVAQMILEELAAPSPVLI
jgi:hydrogenase maturation protease